MIYQNSQQRFPTPRLAQSLMPEFDFEHEAFYVLTEDFSTSADDAHDYVRLECKHGRFQE